MDLLLLQSYRDGQAFTLAMEEAQLLLCIQIEKADHESRQDNQQRRGSAQERVRIASVWCGHAAREWPARGRGD